MIEKKGRGAAWKFNFKDDMEKVIKSYIENADGITDSKSKAIQLLALINEEFENLVINGKRKKQFNDLDEALARFYKIKECDFLQLILKQYIEYGNFEISGEDKDIVHRLDRFQNLNDLIVNYITA